MEDVLIKPEFYQRCFSDWHRTLLSDQKRKAIELVYVDMIDLAREMLSELFPVESR